MRPRYSGGYAREHVLRAASAIRDKRLDMMTMRDDKLIQPSAEEVAGAVLAEAVKMRLIRDDDDFDAADVRRKADARFWFGLGVSFGILFGVEIVGAFTRM